MLNLDVTLVDICILDIMLMPLVDFINRYALSIKSQTFPSESDIKFKAQKCQLVVLKATEIFTGNG